MIKSPPISITFLLFLLFIILFAFTYSSQKDDVVTSIYSYQLQGSLIPYTENPAWLIYENGDPFFLCGAGNPEGFLYRGKRNLDGTRNGDQKDLIAKLASTGTNGIYMQMVRSHGGDACCDGTLDGDKANPFIDGNTSSRLDEDILNQWENWFTEMDNHGIVIYLFFYDDNIQVSNTIGWHLQKNGELNPQEKYYIESIVNRFKHHKHLIWVVMEEVEEMGDDYIEHTKKIAETIKQADTYNHPVAVHKLEGLNFSEFAEDQNIDQFAIQYKVSTPEANHQAMIDATNIASGRYNLNFAEPDDVAVHNKSTLWPIVMGGAYVMPIQWDIASTPIDELQDCGKIVSFMEKTDFNTMAPHDELAYAGSKYVLANPGKSYIAYASVLRGNIGIKNMQSGIYDLKWMDIPSGTMVNEMKINLVEGDKTFEVPENIGNELVVYIKKRKS